MSNETTAESSAPIFFVGMPRSGTTILFEAVARHPALAWPSNYSTAFPRVASLNLLRRMLDNSVIRLHGKKKQYGRVLPLNRLLPQPDEAYEFWNECSGIDFARSSLIGKKADEVTKSRIRMATERLRQWQKRPRFAAKLTGPARIDYLDSVFPDAIFVHVIRDGRAVVHSLMRVSFWQSQGGYDAPFWKDLLDPAAIAAWESSDRDAGVLAAMQWRRVIESARDECKHIEPSRYFEVRYEDFLDDPHAFLTTLFARCGLPDSPAVHEHVDSGPPLSSMNRKFESELTPSYVNRLTASMQPVIGQLNYAPPPDA